MPFTDDTSSVTEVSSPRKHPIFYNILSPLPGKIYGVILPLYFHWLPLPTPSVRPEAAAVALATLQNKLVALGPSAPSPGFVEAVGFLFLFVVSQKSDFLQYWPA